MECKCTMLFVICLQYTLRVSQARDLHSHNLTGQILIRLNMFFFLALSHILLCKIKDKAKIASRKHTHVKVQCIIFSLAALCWKIFKSSQNETLYLAKCPNCVNLDSTILDFYIMHASTVPKKGFSRFHWLPQLPPEMSRVMSNLTFRCCSYSHLYTLHL